MSVTTKSAKRPGWIEPRSFSRKNRYALLRVCAMSAASRLIVCVLTTVPDHLAGYGPVQRLEGTELVHFECVSPETPHDAAVLNLFQRRHPERLVTLDLMKQSARYGLSRVDGEEHVQLLHALDLRRRHRFHVHERPAQRPDVDLLGNLFDLIELGVDRLLGHRVELHRDPGFRRLEAEAAPHVPRLL